MTRKPQERGAAAVEFALVLLPLVLLVFGICEFGWIFNQQVSLSNAARESARYYAVHEHLVVSPADRAALKVAAEGYGESAAPSVDWSTGGVTVIDHCAESDPYVEATAEIDMPSLTGFFDAILGDDLTGKGKTTCGG
ncbi:TadE-like protein [Agromyces ramosus]|uniref:TadE-like protein n=1 Tax=Agromyces ramosus TaxID=33879 RepID=A0A4Q7MM99_9MICO|nr:TadE family protein [Agromyces ramosus]RZS68638.1 TadE-like protein [Agromyces ramosus]